MAARIPLNDPSRNGRWPRVFVGAGGSDRIESVGKRDDSRRQRTLRSDQAGRISASVEPFVVESCDNAGHAKETRARGVEGGVIENVRANRCVLFHRVEFVRRQSPRLQQNRV